MLSCNGFGVEARYGIVIRCRSSLWHGPGALALNKRITFFTMIGVNKLFLDFAVFILGCFDGDRDSEVFVGLTSGTIIARHGYPPFDIRIAYGLRSNFITPIYYP